MNDFIKFGLLAALLVMGGMWFTTKQELQKERSITTAQRSASDYCTAKKYDPTTWKQDFTKCYEDVLKDPQMERYQFALSHPSP